MNQKQLLMEAIKTLTSTLMHWEMSFLLPPYKAIMIDVYEIFENTDDTEQCNIHCYFDGSQQCDFYFVYDDKCYFGNFDTDQNDHNYAFSYQQMYIMKGEHIITHH